MNKIQYKPEVCECCGQETTYVIAIDRGTVDIVKQIALFIKNKGINCVHPRKEMEGIFLSSNQVGNLSRPRFHGLIAKVRDNPGNYLLTPKGAKFLRGEEVPRIAIIRKSIAEDGSHNIGYFEPETEKVTVWDFDREGDYWVAINYEISEGNVVERNVPPVQRSIDKF